MLLLKRLKDLKDIFNFLLSRKVKELNKEHTYASFMDMNMVWGSTVGIKGDKLRQL